jgi:hypothetical protein
VSVSVVGLHNRGVAHVCLDTFGVVVCFDSKGSAEVSESMETVLGRFPRSSFSFLPYLNVDACFDLHKPKITRHDVAMVLNRSPA